jgi:hypothetical protein
MAKSMLFGSPLLRDLEKKYDDKQATKTVPMSKTQDVVVFLR